MALLIFIITSWSFTLLHRKMLLCNYTLGFILYTQGYRAICNDINVTKIERKKNLKIYSANCVKAWLVAGTHSDLARSI